jgi:hypothetical protein
MLLVRFLMRELLRLLIQPARQLIDIKNAFTRIDVQLTRSYDLTPNLVEAVKGYMKHERETLDVAINASNVAVTGLKTAEANLSDPEATPGNRQMLMLPALPLQQFVFDMGGNSFGSHVLYSQ